MCAATGALAALAGALAGTRSRRTGAVAGGGWLWRLLGVCLDASTEALGARRRHRPARDERAQAKGTARGGGVADRAGRARGRARRH